MIYYPIPLHLQPVYQDIGYQKGQLPEVSLPMFPGISPVEQEQVVYALKDCLLEV